MSDVDISVALAALDAIAQVLEWPLFITEDEFDHEVMPCIQRIIDTQGTEVEDECDLVMSRILGKLVCF